MNIRFVAIFAILTFVSSIQAGLVGKSWTEDEALIIRDKLRRVWSDPVNIFKDFDIKEKSPKSLDFVYDPYKMLSTKNCSNCDDWFEGEKRKKDLSFTEPKALRLAFHDCMPYQDGTGGCDGCLNLDENVEDNLGLQHTAAILEKIYTDVNFPPPISTNPKNLPDSPKNLGISRADLWAFAGLVAFDEYMQFTKSKCKHHEFDLNCGDRSTPCYSPLPSSYLKMFQTGRQDCDPKSGASSRNQYRASKVEAHPHLGLNGEMTVKYFKDKFNMNGRETLALLGVHTVGHFNGISSHLDYSWTRETYRSDRWKVFNNEYYKNLALRPKLIKDGYCTGTMDDKPGKASIDIFINPFGGFAAKNPWTKSKEKPGIMSWRITYERGPTCNTSDINHPNVKEDKNDFFEDVWEKCCAAKAAGCVKTSTCPEDCTRDVQGRLRFTSPEVGLYLDWKVDDNGLPYGCDVFNLAGGRTEKNFRYKFEVGKSDCPKQTMLENGKKGKPLYKRVEFYADNQESWLGDLVKAFKKMQSNGYGKLENGPSSFWRHDCGCFETHFGQYKGHYKFTDNVPSVLDCQKICQQEAPCQFFIWMTDNKSCRLYKERPPTDNVQLNVKKTVFGPKTCQVSERCMSAFKDYM